MINGAHDHSLRAGRRTAALIPEAMHKVLPGTGHACCIEDPAGFDALERYPTKLNQFDGGKSVFRAGAA